MALSLFLGEKMRTLLESWWQSPRLEKKYLPFTLLSGHKQVTQSFQTSAHSLVNMYGGGSDGKASAYNEGDPGSIPGSGRSPGEGNRNPLQYSCLENPMDRGAWLATVHGINKESDTTERLHYHYGCEDWIRWFVLQIFVGHLPYPMWYTQFWA